MTVNFALVGIGLLQKSFLSHENISFEVIQNDKKIKVLQI